MLSLPIPLRVLLAAQPELVTPVPQMMQRVVTRHLLTGTGLKADEGHGGAVKLTQRFRSAANLNIHLHCLVLDGVYRCDADGEPVFVEASAPTDDELRALLQTVIARLMKMLTRRGVLVEDMGRTWLAEPDADAEEARTLRPLQAAAITYRIAFGPRAGQKVLTLRGAERGHGAVPEDGTVPREGLAHAKRARGLQGMPRENWVRQTLCADIDGFSLHAAVRVEAHDRKRLEQLCRYVTRPALSGQTNACSSMLRAGAATASEAGPIQVWSGRISWARLLKRVFDIDMHTCPNCGGGELSIIAATVERPVIDKILTHLGLDPQPPPRGRAREVVQD